MNPTSGKSDPGPFKLNRPLVFTDYDFQRVVVTVQS